MLDVIKEIEHKIQNIFHTSHFMKQKFYIEKKAWNKERCH